MSTSKRTRDTAAAFFFKHAGYSYQPGVETRVQGRWRCARDLADAEKHAQAMEWTATWEQDPNHAHEGCACAALEHLTCLLVNRRGEVLASLSGVCGADVNGYARVVEAELAQEARAEIQAETLTAI